MKHIQIITAQCYCCCRCCRRCSSLDCGVAGVVLLSVPL